MGTTNHTPDPTQGALVDAAGVIVLPDDNEKVKADNIQLGDQQLADWIAFLTKGPGNDIDFKITGNGTPPAGGYAPTTNKIIIKGTGLDVSGGGEFTSDNIGNSTYVGIQKFQGEIERDGAGAVLRHRHADLNAASSAISLDDSADYFYVYNPSNAVTTYTLQQGGLVRRTLHLRVYNLAAGNTLIINRGSGGTILTLTPVGASKFYGLDFELDLGGRWVLGMISGDEAIAYGAPG